MNKPIVLYGYLDGDENVKRCRSCDYCASYGLTLVEYGDYVPEFTMFYCSKHFEDYTNHFIWDISSPYLGFVNITNYNP